MPRELFQKTAIRGVRKNAERWQATCYAAQKEQSRNYSTLSGLPVKPLYTPADVEHLDYMRDLGFPGEEPFIRDHPAGLRTCFDTDCKAGLARRTPGHVS